MTQEEIIKFEDEFDPILGEHWFSKTPLEKERWHKHLTNFFTKDRQSILEEVEAALPKQRDGKKGRVSTEEYNYVDGFNECRIDTLEAIKKLKDK